MAQPNTDSLSRQPSFTVSRGPSFISQVEGLQTEGTIEGSIQILSVKSPIEEHAGYHRDSTKFSTRDRLTQELLHRQRRLGSGATNRTLSRGLSERVNTPLQLRVVTPQPNNHSQRSNSNEFPVRLQNLEFKFKLTTSAKKSRVRKFMFGDNNNLQTGSSKTITTLDNKIDGDSVNKGDKSYDNILNVEPTNEDKQTNGEKEIYKEKLDGEGLLEENRIAIAVEFFKISSLDNATTAGSLSDFGQGNDAIAEKTLPPVSPPAPPVEQPKPPPKKREIIKKEKKVKPPPTPEPKPPTPTLVAQEPTPSPPPIEEEKPVSREISVVREKTPPKLPPIEVPELPEFQEVQKEAKSNKKRGTLIEVTPELPEQKKKLPGPPKLAPRIKTRQPKRRKVAEAPVTSQELQQLSDPLDFLAKYCIINPDRLPFYERIFSGAISVQTPRYSRDQQSGGLVSLPPAQLSEHELNMLKDMTVITHAQTPRRDGLNVPEQYLEKLNYSIEFIKTKQETLQDHMTKLQGEKIRLMAQLAKEMDRDIARVDYKTKGSKKKKKDDDDSSPKKKKKKKGAEPDYDNMGAMATTLKNFQPTKASDITDEVIVSRMDEKMLKRAKKDPIVKQLSIEISRDIEKLKNFDQRITQIEDEKDLVGLYCMDHYFAEQDNSQPPYAFRRQQSRLYQKLHPDPDVEMNTEEVETALQQINNKLLSEKEFQYIYFILDLPKREKINFRLFSIIAALSEKVTQMDPVIRKLLNKVDYNALDVKMDKSKELFELLQDEDLAPVGNAPAETLAVELTAGGLTPEHTSYVLSKFNREGRGFVDFLDFVTYVPLFVDIHKRIVEDPFNDCLDI